MSEENKQEENKTEEVKVKIQGKEFILTKTEDNKYSGKISFKIGDIENRDIEVSYILSQADDGSEIIKLSLKENQKISSNIGGIKNEVEVSEISFILDEIYIRLTKIQKISFKIGDIENRDIEVSDICFISDKIYIRLTKIQKISFKIGDIENRDIEVHQHILLHSNSNLEETFLAANQEISFKIYDIEYKVKIYNSLLKFYDNSIPQKISPLEKMNNCYFFYKNRKYKLSFNAKEDITFNANGELNYTCVACSGTRLQEIEEQDRIYNLENRTNNLEEKQSIATEGDWQFVKITGIIGAGCIILALFLCIFNNTIGLIFNYNFNYDKTFNKYTFFYEILKRTPIIILVILGFKFLQLAFERLRLIGKVEQVRNYITLTADNDTKKDLLKTIAIPFFAPKKVKSSVFDGLIDKLSINIGNKEDKNKNK